MSYVCTSASNNVSYVSNICNEMTNEVGISVDPDLVFSTPELQYIVLVCEMKQSMILLKQNLLKQ